MKIGFIGAGNMGGALIKRLKDDHDIIAYDVCPEAVAALGVSLAKTPKEAVLSSDVVFLAVKPNVLSSVLEGIKEVVGTKTVVSIAAGKTIAYLYDFLPKTAHVVRVMPNVAAQVGEGMAAIAVSPSVSQEETDTVVSLMESVGDALVLPETLFDAVTALSGSGPAFVFLFIEALADAGVQAGLPRVAALQMAEQTVLGSAKMAIKTKLHPGELKDMVCSPGGTTIAGVAALENAAFRGAVMNAVREAAEKSKAMS